MALETAAVAGQRKRQLLPSGFRKDLVQFVRKHSHVFESNPELKPIGVRFFKALLQPRRRAGRKCEPDITLASRLFRRHRKRYAGESYGRTWNRIYPIAIPGLDALSRQEASREKRNLRAAVRARPYARRRRRTRAKE